MHIVLMVMVSPVHALMQGPEHRTLNTMADSTLLATARLGYNTLTSQHAAACVAATIAFSCSCIIPTQSQPSSCITFHRMAPSMLHPRLPSTIHNYPPSSLQLSLWCAKQAQLIPWHQQVLHSHASHDEKQAQAGADHSHWPCCLQAGAPLMTSCSPPGGSDGPHRARWGPALLWSSAAVCACPAVFHAVHCWYGPCWCGPVRPLLVWPLLVWPLLVWPVCCMHTMLVATSSS
jgi:hypothetical protein